MPHGSVRIWPGNVPPSVTNTVTVVFPDPGPDATSVVIGVEDTFGLTDVAVR